MKSGPEYFFVVKWFPALGAWKPLSGGVSCFHARRFTSAAAAELVAHEVAADFAEPIGVMGPCHDESEARLLAPFGADYG